MKYSISEFTEKQIEIMKVILSLVDAGSFPAITEIKNKLSYGSTVSRSAISCSLEYLEKDLVIKIVKNDSSKTSRGNFSVIKPTPLAYQIFRAVP